MSLPQDASAAPAVPSLSARKPFWWRLAAVGVLAVVFWLDALTPPGVAIPMLYVVATLMFVRAGRPWEPLAVAAVATILTIAGTSVTPAGGSEAIAFVNRPLEILAIWIAAGLTAVNRVLVERWSRQASVDRQAVDESLKTLEDMRYALDQAAIVATTDQRGIITYVNEKFCEISKYAREELLGQDHRIINSGYHPKDFIRELWRTIAQGQVWRGEIRNRAKDGSLYWVDTTIVPFLDNSGKPRQYLAIRSDITQRKVAEARLREQESLTQLGELATIVAHEVRNPLAGLRGGLQVLETRLPRDMREREVIGTMIERIDALNDKVEDILLFARPKPPRPKAVELGPVLAEAASAARAAARVAPPPIELRAETVAVMADPEMLRAVLLNLLLNACQAAGARPVEVVTTLRNGRCQLSILDRGPGIPVDVRQRVFEPFFTTKRGGTGLGLAIVKRLMDLQGGSVSLTDREGGGSVATIELPVSGEAHPRSSAPRGPD